MRDPGFLSFNPCHYHDRDCVRRSANAPITDRHSVLDKESRASISVDIIQRTVAEHFDLRPADITGKKRSKDIAWPRQIAMHLSRTMTSQSFPVIGEAFNRNHATILYAHDQVSQRAKDDRSLQQTLYILKDKVNKNCVKANQAS